MSRSKKKNPIYTDVNHYSKKLASRLFRKKNKAVLRNLLKGNSDITFKLKHEVICQWDVCDWVYRDLDLWYLGNDAYKAWMK